MTRMDVREKLVEIVKKATYSSLPSNTEDFHLNMFVTNLLSHGVTVQEWISVTERLPRNYTPVLAYIPSLAQTMQQTVHECHIGADGEWHSSTAPAYREGVTHWMPMPQPPKGQ